MNWFRNSTRKQWLALGMGVIVAAGATAFVLQNGTEAEEITSALPAVAMTSAASLASENTISLVGSVRAFSEAAVTAERGGRVTSVRVGLGDTVGAGQVLVTLENAAESAAVLQAEGAYDAAVAAAAQSDIGPAEAATGLRSAQTSAVATIRTTYSTISDVVENDIDEFFSDPSSFVPGLKIDGKGRTAELNQTRIEFRDRLSEMSARSVRLSTNTDLESEITFAISQLDATIVFLSTFITVFNDQDNSNRYTDAEIRSFSSKFTTLRNSLISQQSQLENALASLEAAADAVRRAEINATGGTNSAADAQVKQALGSLRAAQANYAKTILRAPVSGTVNELPVRVGDFISAQSKVAEVANNNALEIVTYASDAELFALQPGDTVLIEGQYEGVITTIAPAVDSTTGKTEVRIASDNANIKNGDTVRITSAVTIEDIGTSEVRVPLTAVKFEREDGFMFTVTDGKLVKFPVSLGAVFGGEVTIVDGLTITDEFVIDARGLREGDDVEVID